MKIYDNGVHGIVSSMKCLPMSQDLEFQGISKAQHKGLVKKRNSKKEKKNKKTKGENHMFLVL